ncbi:hypothetical protein BJP08_01560 [Corynebacterium sp. NML140438]|nr:hypothetical protein BJP08_01560 [Corynebacterium sp. NML140438]
MYAPNKVCGLTSWSDAQAAKAEGAVYGGLIFEESSPRNVSRETSSEIITHEPGLRYVAESRRTSGYGELIQPGINAVQVHAPYQGSLEAERSLVERVRAEIGEGVELWRAVSMSAESGAEVALGIRGGVDKLVLDARVGGSAEIFRWADIPDEVRGDSLLADGLHPSNLAGAMRRAFAIIGNYHYPRTNNN